jgi:SAM-dependent methyltransferase
MKRLLKKILQRLHLLGRAAIIYNNLKLLGHFSLLREIKIRLRGVPDRLPLPSSSIIFDVIGHGWRSIYYDSGKIIVDYMLKNLEKNQIRIAASTRVLDFGCGCGRLLRHLYFSKKPECSGTDYNERLIRWCADNLPFAKFTVNRLEPPLPYRGGHFDLIYAQSVFTHLSEELQLKWLAEFHRILKTDGLLYVTTHGRQFIHKLNEVERDVFEGGRVVVQHSEDQGRNICGAFQLPIYFKRKVKSGFALIDFIPGQEEVHLQQDVNLFRKTKKPLIFE